MIYFDSAYVAKCYLNEPGAERVRTLAGGASGLCSLELARIEFTCILRRHVREGHLTDRQADEVLAEFSDDERSGVWTWFPMTSALVERACRQVRDAPAHAFLRAGDALHLACASENGFTEVYTNDRHMLAGAVHFRLRGRDVIADTE